LQNWKDPEEISSLSMLFLKTFFHVTARYKRNTMIHENENDVW